MKKISIIFLLLLQIFQILSIKPNDTDTINLNGSYSKKCENVEEKYFQINITSANIPNFLKIQVTNTESTKNPSYIMTFVKSLDPSAEREQISKGEKSSLMWLTKNQLDKENNLLYVTCYNPPCNYNLNLESSNELNMDFDTQFNLYVTDNNKEIEINFSSEKDGFKASFITLWGIGNKNPEVTLLEGYDYIRSKNYNIFKIKTDSMNKSSYIMKIKAEVGDVINIGSSSLDTNLENTLLNNSPEKKGFISNNANYTNEECYFINIAGYQENVNYYISGLIYTKVAELYYKNGNKELIQNSESIITNGSFIHTIEPSTDNKRYICVTFPTNDADKYNLEEIVYSIQLSDPKQSESKINLYSPQTIGEIYPRMLKEGEIFLFTGVPLSDDTRELSFNMISVFGLPDMYIDICTNYPLCDKYDYNISNKLENPISMNGQSSYKLNSTNIKIFSPMDTNQYVLIVKCVKGKNPNGSPCGFRTIFNTGKSVINLKENELYSQFIKSGEKDLYKINFSGQEKIQKIYVDLMVFTGDIIFNPIQTNLNAKKIYNANKIFYSITIDDKFPENKEVDFNVIGSKNSYYSIKYSLIRDNDDSWISNIIETGVSYLVTIDPNVTDSDKEKKPLKYVKFSNLKIYEGIPFLVNFNSLNCKLNVTAKRFKDDGNYYYESIDSFDQYYQDIVYKNKENEYEYMLKINEMDSSIYNNKLCMVYASSTILNKEDLDERQILISDNEPKQIVFKDTIDIIEYIYPHSNINNDVIIKFNLLDIARYIVTISYAFKKKSEIIQTGNDIIYLHHNEWKSIAKTSDILPIIISIYKDASLVEDEPKLEISVKAVQDNTPTYIQKNKAQIDFLLGNNTQYYYTDLGKGEEGEILVNYHRGSGRLFGKIVPKNIEKPEEGANWREMYKFPETVEESLEFYGYIKRIIIKSSDTEDCGEGCYLLLTLRTSVLSIQDFDFREFPFNIMIYTNTPSSQVDTNPIIHIPLNEYIIGNLNLHGDNKIYEFYSTSFTHDAQSILIDFQSKVVNFYIKVGLNSKPSLTDKDFYFESFGDDTIYEIKKSDFLKKCEEKGIIIPYPNSLLGLGLTIGLWTNKTDSLYTTVYSIKVNLLFHENEVYENLSIYEVQTDQKTLCKPQKLSTGEYRCLFVIFYQGIDASSHLLIYPEIQDYVPFKMYADFIEQSRYEYYDSTYLIRTIPNKDSRYSNENTGLEYLYVPHGLKYGQHLYLNILLTQDSIVELYTSFYTYDFQLSPNPSSPQLFIIENKFMFEFTTEEDLSVIIKSICGEGKIQWHSDEGVEYALTGFDKIISLSSSLIDRSDPAKLYSNLDITSTYTNPKSNCPGFAFYISYLLRPKDINLDGIPLGKSTRMAYRDTDLPVYIYTEIFYLDKDVHSFINMYELVGEMEGGLQEKVPFEFSATLVNDTIVMDAKQDKKILENLKFEFKGVYDPMIKSGVVLITKNDIAKSKLEIKDGPTVILKISKNMEYPKMKDTKFKRLTIEASINQDNTEIPTVPEVYQYGKLGLLSEKNVYKLKTKKSENYMRIHFSSCSDKIRYVISNSPDGKETSPFNEFEDIFAYGKQVITFNSDADNNKYIYLIVYHQNDKASTDKITNYAFKYMTASRKELFKEYTIPSNEGFSLDTKEDGDDYVYTFKITPLSYSDIDIKYFIKFTPKSNWIDGEKDNTISLKESASYVDELKELNIVDDKIVKEYKMKEIDYRYVQIIAMVNDKGNYEYVGYGSIYIKDAIWWKILLIVLAVAIVVIVVIFTIRYYLKRKRDIGRQLEGLEGTMVSRYTEASIA